MSANVRRRRRSLEERIGAALRHGRAGDLAGRGETLPRDRGGGTGGRVSASPGLDPGGTVIEHLTAYAAAGQTIAAGGGQLQFDREAGPPTQRRGFETFSSRLAADGSVGDIPVDITGELEMVLSGRWASHEPSGDITFTRTRADDGTVETRTYALGPVTSYAFDLVTLGWEVRAGDTITVDLPNGEGSGQTLSEATLAMRVIGVASPTTAPVASVIATNSYNEEASRPASVTVDGTSAIRPGDLLVVFLSIAEPNVTMPSGWTHEAATGSGDARYRIDYRVAQAGDDTASWTWTATGGASGGLKANATLAIVRNANTADPFDGTPGFDAQYTIGTTSFTPTMTSTEATSKLLLFARTGNVASAVHSAAGLTEVGQWIAAADTTNVASLWEGVASGGAESETVSWSGSSSGGSALVAIRSS